MKQILYFTLLLVVIPFFVVFIGISEKVKTINEDKTKEIFVRVKREATGEIQKIDIEDYVLGVVAGEMPIAFHIEALKAQAVAARSYVLKRIENNNNTEYDVVDSVTNQVYLDTEYLKKKWKDNYNNNIEKLKKAVSETAGEYISYNGEVADALFFSTSNGYTENSEDIFSSAIPYLRSVSSTWDETTSPVFNDKKTYDLDTFFNLLGIEDKTRLDVEITKKLNSGRVLLIKINDIEMKGVDVQKKLELRSTDFEITQVDNNVVINTSGYGHGVGMSQYGALGMAEDGYTYDEILKYYYQNIEIKNYNKI